MLITEQTALDEFCASLKSETFITVDTEFLREKTYYPKLCLVQIGAEDGRAAAVDPLAEGLDMAPVFDLLCDEKILKVLHAARQDLEIFYNLTGKVVKPFFDTQIAAMVCGYGDSIGYENLVRNITGGQIDKSSQYTNWSNRPLSEKQVHYALGDVTHLVGVYQSLSAELERRNRVHWVLEEEAVLEDPATYDVDVNEMWRKVKVKTPKPQTLAVLRGLAAWREMRAQRKNLPKNWVMKDDSLADMAAQAPKDVKALKKIRNMSSDLAEGHIGRELLEVIHSALESDKASWPVVERRKPPSARVMATVEILKLLLKIQSSEHEVAAKLIANASDLEDIAKHDDADVPAMRGWRREIFGDEALAMKHGKVSIGLKDDKIVKFKMG
ncbi:MAG: ribonuclease D [Alphaproteobacteria bacterium]|nr:ribonuclease D [Alphaproteobacteria bacterium]